MVLEVLLIGGSAWLWRNKKEEIRKLARAFTEATQSEGRRQLHEDLNPGLKEAEEKNQLEAKNMARMSAGATGLALMGKVSPVLPAVGAGMALYLARDMFYQIRKDFKQGRYVTVYSFGALTLVGMLAVGRLVLVTMSGLLGAYFYRVISGLEQSSSRQLVNVFGERPEQVWLLCDGTEVQIDFHEIQVGDAVVVHPGEVIPVDGLVRDGEGQVDQHLLTGESDPVEKVQGDPVFAATLLLTGRLIVSVEKAGRDTAASKIGDALNQTQNYKDSLRNRGMEMADRFVPAMLAISGVTLLSMGAQPALAVTWAGLGQPMGGLGPLTVLSYLQILSRRGILVKDGRVFESMREVDTLIFDKTGTLTLEQPTVGAIHALDGFDEETLLRYAAAAEFRQPHPIARAILERAEREQLELPEVCEASYEIGYGIKVSLDGREIHVGSARFLEQSGVKMSKKTSGIRKQAETAGCSLIYIGIDKKQAGALEIHPTIRPEAAEVIRAMKKRGMRLYIISGDHEAPTRRMAETHGIDHYFAEVLPENKAAIVQRLRNEGRFVCFVGDGINDAIALKSSQISVSLKGASSAAVDTAQIVLMDGSLNHLESLFQFADEFEETMNRNKTVSIVPGCITIGGVHLLHFGIPASMGIFYLGCFAGLANVLWPLVVHEDTEPDFPQSDKATAPEPKRLAGP